METRHFPELSIALRNVLIIDPRSNWNEERRDLFIKDGIIVSSLPNTADIDIEAQSLFVTPAMTDLRCFVREPGLEHQERVQTALNAAAGGGFSRILAHSSAGAVLNSASDISFLLGRAHGHMVRLYPSGAVSHELNGEDLNELYDMHQAGAITFSNGNRSYHHYGLLMRALQYTTQSGALIMSHALDRELDHKGQVNESETTIHTGLKQSPAIAEFSEIQKQIEVARYCNRPIHFSHISAAESVALIRKAKSEGVKVSCDVSIMHLCFTDEQVLSYNSQFKLNPPLRSERDRQALIAGVNDGSIDAIVSDHQPANEELKKVEFDYAVFGCINLQTMYSLYEQYLSRDINREVWVAASSIRPSQLLNEEVPVIAVGNPSELALFDSEVLWTYQQKNNLSKSNNHPLFGSALKGKCIATITPVGISYNSTQ